jgi:YD repeat-containing protein
MNPSRAGGQARLMLALLGFISLIAVRPETARALTPTIDPGTDLWVLISGSNCAEINTPDLFPPCRPTYTSPLEACISGSSKFPLVTNVTVALGGTPPNQTGACIIAFGNPQDGCFGTPTFAGCTVNVGPVEFAKTSCPSNSTKISSILCVCDPGSVEADGSCSGGTNNGAPCPGCGNPANPANGNKFEQQLVYRGLNGFGLSLAFNTFDDYRTRFGRRWRDSFDRRVTVNGPQAFAYRPDGKAFQFNAVGGGWAPDASVNHRLTELRNAAGTRTGWQLYVPEGDESESYDAAGRLVSIRSRVGLVQSLVYSDGTSGGPRGGFVLDDSGQPTAIALPPGLLIQAVDHFGRVLALGYNAAPRVVAVTDPSGGVYRFGYGANANLASLTFPDGAVRRYIYNEPENTGGANFFNALTGIVDENGDRYATFQYDSRERVVSTEHSGAQRYLLSYGAGATTVTDPLGAVRSYGFLRVLGTFKNTDISNLPCPSCGPALQAFEANGNVVSQTDWNGNRTVFGYDLARNLETTRTEASSTPQARTVTTQWHPAFRLPVRTAEPLRITSYAYNGDGGANCGVAADGTLIPGVLCSKTVQPTSDANGASGFGAISSGTPRTWSYTYDENGFVLSVDGPRTDVADVTRHAYYAADDPDPGRRGNVAAIANALGHTTRILAYNAHGQPLAIADPNGLTTTLAYDARQRLVARDVGGETTTYAYDLVGQLVRVILPDGSSLAYSYDSAHRLTGIADSLGNRIAYALDAMGNRTREDVRDPAGDLAQTRSRVFDQLNRLAQDIGAQSQATQYAYDPQGNVTRVTDPLNHLTSSAYDALNRLVAVTDPGNGITRYAYDGVDQLVAVTDPRKLTTSYNYDGLANLNAQASPDAGTTLNTYDSAGNLLTQTDAKGQTTSYTYDALNRVTSIVFADGSRQAYGYDQGANGLGRLTFFAETDPQAKITILHDYAYDAHGRAVLENRTMNGVTYAFGYAYDAAGRLAGLVYPSGRTVAYGFDAVGRINQVSTTAPPAAGGATQVIASNVVYQPFGGVKSYTLGNGQTYSRSYDQDGRIASYGSGSQLFSLGYDPAGRIVSIADAANASSNTYGYDGLDRLTSALTPAASFAYAYDAVGNRTSKSVGTATETYTYAATSNRIASIAGAAGRSFSFDANGSTLDDGNNQYAYDARGRMASATSASGTTFYKVNALGQRVRKTNFTDDRVFLYDLRGHLIAETGPGGTLKREYLYLNDIPLAVIQ